MVATPPQQNNYSTPIYETVHFHPIHMVIEGEKGERSFVGTEGDFQPGAMQKNNIYIMASAPPATQINGKTTFVNPTVTATKKQRVPQVYNV